MDEFKEQNKDIDVQAIVQRAIAEYVRQDTTKREPALKAELIEERRRRETLEKRLNTMAEESKKSRELADQAERGSKIRNELQALGVVKLDVAYKAVQDDIVRTEDGRLVARTESGEVGVREYLAGFVHDNPEFLPARIPGGTGLSSASRSSQPQSPVTLNMITPSMTAEERERVRQEILRVTSQDKH